MTPADPPVTNDDLAAAVQQHSRRLAAMAFEHYPDSDPAQVAADVKIVLRAWHREHIDAHLLALANIAASVGGDMALDDLWDTARWTVAG